MVGILTSMDGHNLHLYNVRICVGWVLWEGRVIRSGSGILWFKLVMQEEHTLCWQDTWIDLRSFWENFPKLFFKCLYIHNATFIECGIGEDHSLGGMKKPSHKYFFGQLRRKISHNLNITIEASQIM
jgi:hypothetical protein